MMKNKMKGVAMSSSPYVLDEEMKAKFKHQRLMQDFVDLHKGTEAMKKRLQKAKQRKQTLLGEVSFLRRRYKFLTRNQTSKTQAPPPPPSDRIRVPSRPQQHRKEPNVLPSRRRSPVLDLNQISNGEEALEYQAYEEPHRVEKKPRKYSVGVGDELQQANDVKLSVCREVVNGTKRSGKRKISWQDQVPLRV